jgi:lipopolysaccharide export LptBFGC system permease protein LptF
LYRISTPVLLAAAALSVGMFLLDNQYLPEINQRQDALRNRIKGRPPQTYYRPDRQWIFGQSNRIYNYRFFDPDHNVFANLSIFDFDPQSLRMTRRVYAARAFWEASLQVRLSAQLYRKFFFPLSAFVVALTGIPFSFSAGRKGALSVSIGIAPIYWVFGLGGVYLLPRMPT